MLILAKLVFKSYMPKQLEIGMWFKRHHSDVLLGKIHNYLTIYELKEIPRDMEEYISINGAPVEPYIIQPMKNPDDPEEVLVTSDFVGWWESDQGAEDDSGAWFENIVLEDLSPKIINEWIYGENGDNDGLIALEVNEDREAITYLDEEGNDTGKVIIKQSEYVDEEDDDEDTVEEEYLEDEEPSEDDDDPEFELGGSE